MGNFYPASGEFGNQSVGASYLLNSGISGVRRDLTRSVCLQFIDIGTWEEGGTGFGVM